MQDTRSRIALPEHRMNVRIAFLAVAIAVPSAYMIFHRYIQAKKMEKEVYFQELETEIEREITAERIASALTPENKADFEKRLQRETKNGPSRPSNNA